MTRAYASAAETSQVDLFWASFEITTTHREGTIASMSLPTSALLSRIRWRIADPISTSQLFDFEPTVETFWKKFAADVGTEHLAPALNLIEKCSIFSSSCASRERQVALVRGSG